jgi:hypothetical protein
MRPSTHAICSLVLAACASASAPARAPSGAASARAVVARAEALGARPVWPNFDSRRIPVAIYDGTRTWLFRHPHPPPPFQRVAGESAVYQAPGQHEAVRANASARIGGVLTATLLLTGEARARTIDELAALHQHEAFHVHQEHRHPGWRADEATLFTYPVDEPEGLHLRRLETEALRRALSARGHGEAACWSIAAMDLRRERYGRLPAAAVAYERGTELNEGLAQYVEIASLGRRDGPALPEGGFPPDRVRERGYAIGHAIATLLDRLAAGSRWKEALESGRAGSLDELLDAALPPRPARRCALPDGAVAQARERARRDVAALVERRAGAARAFRGRPGFRVVVRTEADAVLWPQGFDPLNVMLVGAGEVLHARWVKLGNERGFVEILDWEALTQASGEHPLMNGVREVVVTGLRGPPVLHQAGDRVIVEAPGLRVELRGAAAELAPGELVIRAR